MQPPVLRYTPVHGMLVVTFHKTNWLRLFSTGSPRVTPGILECASEHTGGKKNLIATHRLKNGSKLLADFSQQHVAVTCG